MTQTSSGCDGSHGTVRDFWGCEQGGASHLLNPRGLLGGHFLGLPAAHSPACLAMETTLASSSNALLGQGGLWDRLLLSI